jgi:hypothetical protein
MIIFDHASVTRILNSSNVRDDINGFAKPVVAYNILFAGHDKPAHSLITILDKYHAQY